MCEPPLVLFAELSIFTLKTMQHVWGKLKLYLNCLLKVIMELPQAVLRRLCPTYIAIHPLLSLRYGTHHTPHKKLIWC